ncbi:iron-siderophore ABC transporter substrate-binding protein [Actinocorallia sp. A-T 12471]|uniref:iron-siderophore ABC transporter substrate-binding protein n=1 Tax=Actinocorallia sp. A-T 12471 TaxID=3089813 RepID=UPI0029D40920|nr:iron-siderophore ABC transporter substrate-binding protein [Actinocorallia sp. A-T 12471]MDX6741207.1 iron-siderophore ABC transporter substrate-binding protein [Actinocorallia sp. A-T 12471]
MLRTLKFLLPAAALVLSAACGSGTENGPGDGSANPPTAAFPVTVEHKYGSTTVERAPERVVTVGLSDQDAVLALGVMPVGTTEWLGEYPGAIGPWAQDKIAGRELPTVMKDTGTGPSAEKIASLRPDVIFALYSGLTKEQYTTLSKIAPVVAQPGDVADYAIAWPQLTRTVGKVLGKADEAEKLVNGAEDALKKAAVANPSFKGAKALMATPYEGVFVYGGDDPRSQVLTALGFTLPDGLKEAVGDEFGANISEERTDLLDNDVTVWLVGAGDEDGAKLHKNKAYANQRVVKEGREVLIVESSDYGNSISFVSVLSIPYFVERLVPQLAAAIDGDPNTEVPRS